VAGVVALIGRNASESEQRVQSLIDTLEGGAPASDWIATRIADVESFTTAIGKGQLSVDQINEYLRASDTDARAMLNTWREAAGYGRFENVVDDLHDMRNEFQAANEVIDANREATIRAGNAALDFGSALEHERDALYESTTATRRSTDAALANTTAVRDSISARREAVDPVYALHQAERQATESLVALTEAEATYTRDSPEYREALDAATGANIDLDAARAGVNAGNYSAYRDEVYRLTFDLRDLAGKADLTADDIVDAIGRINASELYDKTMTIYQKVSSAGGAASYLAKGGPFSRGDVAVVGEEGPEVAVFGSDGYMIPNDKIRQVGPSLNGSSAVVPAGGSAQNIYVTVTGDVYGLRDLESVVVGAITTAQQRGRIAAPVGADTPPARPARPPA